MNAGTVCLKQFSRWRSEVKNAEDACINFEMGMQSTGMRSMARSSSTCSVSAEFINQEPRQVNGYYCFRLFQAMCEHHAYGTHNSSLVPAITVPHSPASGREGSVLYCFNQRIWTTLALRYRSRLYVRLYVEESCWPECRCWRYWTIDRANKTSNRAQQMCLPIHGHPKRADEQAYSRSTHCITYRPRAMPHFNA